MNKFRFSLGLTLLALWLISCTEAPAQSSVPPAIVVIQPQALSTAPKPTNTRSAVAKVSETATATAVVPTDTPTPSATPAATATATATLIPTLTPTPFEQMVLIGHSFEERSFYSHQFGQGEKVAIMVGGLHGGYEWNTVTLAYEVIDYLRDNETVVPDNVSLHIIPVANPDGLFRVTGTNGRFTREQVAEDTVPGRFNGRDVDLNRNWDCQWSETAVWRDQTVSGGAAPFSEPENQALRSFFLAQQPEVVIFWHSAAGAVYGAGCGGLYQPAWEWAQLYSEASSYPPFAGFTQYAVTGDASDWLARQAIPSFTVELINHEDIDWPQNLAGVLAVLEALAAPPQDDTFAPP